MVCTQRKRTAAGTLRFLQFIIFCILLLGSASAFAQTSGLIYKAAVGAGKTVLDPNGDNYVSSTTSGFTSNDVSESEIPYKAVPQVASEPNSDLASGPSCGFTDFVDDGTEQSVGVYLDSNNNLLFRFRLGGTAPNSKGYSILVDSDQKFGASGDNKDPNYVNGNPGFEFEIVLETNFGVRLNDVDGTTTPVSRRLIAYDSSAQKSLAYNIYSGASCGTKYFIDFYIPFSVITTYFPSVTPSTPLRFVANTVMAPTSALKGPISDIGGIVDNNSSYGGNTDLIWSTAVNNFYPTAASDIDSGLAADRSNAPTLSSIVNGATSVSVTTDAGGLVKIYKTGTSTPICSTTVASGGTFTVSSCGTLVTGDKIYATLTATSKSESVSSNVVTVTTCAGASAVPTGFVEKNNEKNFQGSSVIGSVIKIYNNGTLYTSFTSTSDPWTVNMCSITGGTQFCVPCGTWYATATETGKCESGPSASVCITSSGAGGAQCKTAQTSTSAPTITTTTIYTTTTSLSGTSVGATDLIYIYVNDVEAGTTSSISGSWTISGLSFNLGDVVKAVAKGSAANTCRSVSSATITVTEVTKAPSITSSVYAGTGISSVSGTSPSASGTTIYVYVTGNATPVCTTTVSSTGTWACTGLTLTAGSTVYATALATGKVISSSSNVVTVQASASTITPTITGSYTAGNTTVSGTLSTSATSGTKVILYLDGTAIDSVTVNSGTSWSVSTLSATRYNDKYLYAGGVLTAKVKSSTTSTGPSSNSVTVSCVTPLTSKTVTGVTPICSGNSAQITITASESDVIYTLTDITGDTAYGPSAAGTGSDLAISSDVLTASSTFYVKAIKIEGTGCSAMLSDSAAVTVNAMPVTSLTVGGSATICSGSSTNITVANSESGFSYQLRNNATNANVGSAVTGTGGTINLPTGALTSTTTFNVLVNGLTSSCSAQLNSTATVTVNSVSTASAGSNQTVCSTSASLSANTPTNGTGTWTLVSGSGTIASPNSASTGITNLGHGSNVFRWTISNSPCTSSTSDVTIERECEASYTVAPIKSAFSTFTVGENLASVTDPDGSIVAASLTSGTLPPGVSLDTSTGEITVSDANQLINTSRLLGVTTTDQYGGTTLNSVTITFDNPLPVELLSFGVKMKEDKTADIRWSTASEINNDYFTIERSANGLNFKELSRVKGAGNSNQVLNYHSADESPMGGISYYRLKQTDFNGTYAYSAIVQLKNDNTVADAARVNIYPNPTSSSNINIQLNGMPEDEAIIGVYDEFGRKRESIKTGLSAGNGKVKLTGTEDLAPGIYTLVVQSGNKLYSQQFVIKN